jgi:tryptophan-rich sensory protein
MIRGPEGDAIQPGLLGLFLVVVASIGHQATGHWAWWILAFFGLWSIVVGFVVWVMWYQDQQS